MAAASEASAGARGRRVVGVAVRTYVADQHSSSPAHLTTLLLLLLLTLATNFRGNIGIPIRDLSRHQATLAHDSHGHAAFHLAGRVSA